MKDSVNVTNNVRRVDNDVGNMDNTVLKKNGGNCWAICTKVVIMMIAILCILSMFIGPYGFNDYVEAAEIQYSGTCGTCSWEIDDDGLCRIYPTDGTSGTLANNTYTKSGFWPWYNYRKSVKKVIVDEGVFANMNASYMFYAMRNCAEMELSNFDTSNVTNMSYMFNYAGSDATTWSLGDLSGWDTSKVTNMSNMFKYAGYNATTFSLDLSGWDTSKVTTMSWMFSYAGYKATTWSLGDLSGWDTSKVTTMSGMFDTAGRNATTWSLGDLSGWDTSKVTNMSNMFNNAGFNATTFSLDLSGWDTSNVTNMYQMFNYAGRYATTWSLGDLSGWDTSKVTTMSWMFDSAGRNATTFSLDLSGWDTSNVTDMSSMFNECGKLSKIVFGKDFNFVGTNHYFSSTGNNWVKVRNIDGTKTYDNTMYTAQQVSALNNTDSTPLLSGTWVKNYNGDDYTTNPDGSVEYVSEDVYWTINSDNVWTYSFSVFDDSLLFYLYEEVIEGYTSEAMSPYYITIKDNMATITNTKNENIVETGKLVISKTVEGIETNDMFEFTINLTGENISGRQVFNNVIFNDGVGKILLKHGEQKMIELPVGTEFTIAEKESVYYNSIINPISGVVTKDTIVTVNAINTYIEQPEPETGTVNITIKKTVENCVDNSAKFAIGGSFKNLEPNTIYETSAGTNFTSDVKGEAFCNIELSADEEVVIFNISEGATYQFTEQAGEYIASYSILNNGNGGNDSIVRNSNANVKSGEVLSTALETADEGEEIVITFHNKFEAVQNLTIKKVVQNEQEDGTFVEDVNCIEAFEFTIAFKGLAEGTTFKSTIGRVTANEDGEAYKTFYLKHGQSAVFYKVPVGVQYEITESKSIYTPSYTIEGTTVASSTGSANKGKHLTTAIETVDANEDGIVTFTNTKVKIRNKAIHLKKAIDAQGNEDILRALEHNSMYKLDGAEYQIIIDGEVVETLVTDINGEATSTQVFKDGVTGIIKEVTPPDGFLLDITEHPFTIDLKDEEDYCEVRVFDVPTFDPTVFRFKKTANGTGVAQGNTSFEGAVFKYEYFDNTDWSGEPTRTWYFETNENGLHAYHTDYLADGYTSDELYTSASNVYMIPLGSVKITEVVCPLGYKEMPVMYATIVQETAGADAKWSFTPETIAYLKTASNGIYEGEEPIDESTLGILTVEKTDVLIMSTGETENITFEGCEFTIYNMSTNPVKIGDNEVAEYGEPCMTIVIGEDGKATTGAVLPIGDYVVKETKGNEYYDKNVAWSYEFTIYGDEINEEIECYCKNNLKPKISILKVNEQGEILSNAKLQIKDENGNVVAEWISADKSYDIRLGEGTYTLHEKNPPAGYWWAKDFEFVVHTQAFGYIQVVDNNGKPVANTEIELRDSLGNLVRTATTDFNGKFGMTEQDSNLIYTVHMVNISNGYEFDGANDFTFKMSHWDTLETDSVNLNVIDYIPIEEGINDDEPSATLNGLTITMVDKKIATMVSSGGTGTIITVVIAVVLGCITGVCIYLGKKKSKEDKN